MESYYMFFILLACTSGLLVDAIVFKDCGSKTASVSSVDVSNCATEPCSFIQGKNSTIKLSMTPNVNSNTCTTQVNGIIAGVKVPFPTEKDACKASLNPKCPLKSGQAETYTLNVFVQKTYPKISLVVNLQLKDDNGDDLICILFPAQIVSG